MTPQQQRDAYRHHAIAEAGGPGTQKARLLAQCFSNQDWLLSEITRGASYEDVATLMVKMQGDLLAQVLSNLEGSDSLTMGREDAALAFGHTIADYALYLLQSASLVTTHDIRVTS